MLNRTQGEDASADLRASEVRFARFFNSTPMAIAGVDQQMYEAAVVDGANRFQRVMKITIPSIAPTIVIMLIFTMAGLFTAGFDQIYLLSNPLVLDVSEVLDTYVYKSGVASGRYSYATAVGLFMSVIGFLLVVSANYTAKKLNGTRIW